MNSLKSIIAHTLKLLVLTGIYFAAGYFGLKFDPTSGFATLVWPSTGIAFAALFIFGLELWPAILVGAFLVNLNTGAPILVALGMGIGNTAEALIGVYFFKKVSVQDKPFQTLRSVILFIIFVALGSTFVSATVGVASLWFGNIVSLSSFAATFRSWWIGDILGDLIVGSFLVVWFIKKPSLRIPLASFIELSVMVLLVFFTGIAVFGNIATSNIGKNAPIEYFVFLPLIWAALRFQQRGASMATILLAVIAIWGTTKGFGPFAHGRLSDNLLLLQLFMAVVAATGMILASIVETRERLTLELKEKIKEIEEEKVIDDAILVSIGNGLVVVDKKSKIVMVNKAFEDLLQWKKEEVMGKDIADIIVVEDESGNKISFSEKVLTRIFSKEEASIGSTVKLAWYFFRKDKTKFPASFVATPIMLRGKIIGGVEVFYDITKEKELEKAKNEFVFLTSHQLRTPLSSIKWHLEVLLKKKTGTLNKKQQEYLKVVDARNEHMIKLVNALLNVSRIDLGQLSVNPEVIDLEQLIMATIKEQEFIIKEKKQKVLLRVVNKIPHIVTDFKLLKIALQNILENAIQYTRPGGEIAFTVAFTAGNIQIALKDTGIGIPKEQQARIFQKFFRADNAILEHAHGTGLGLYIVKAAVEILGGTIKFQSEYSQGTVFTLLLPVESMRKKVGSEVYL